MTGGLFLLCVLLCAFVGAGLGAAVVIRYEMRIMSRPVKPSDISKVAMIATMTQELWRDGEPNIPQPRPIRKDDKLW